MGYREAAELPGLRWTEKYRQYYADNPAMKAEEMARYLDQEDKYLPRAAQNLQEGDLPQLLKLHAAIHRHATTQSYALVLVPVVSKAIVLLMEQYPALFDQLSDEDKVKVLGFKIEVPTEIALYNTSYAYTQGEMDLGPGTFNTGLTLAGLLGRLSTNTPGFIEDRLIRLLSSMDTAYSLYFMDNPPERKKTS